MKRPSQDGHSLAMILLMNRKKHYICPCCKAQHSNDILTAEMEKNIFYIRINKHKHSDKLKHQHQHQHQLIYKYKYKYKYLIHTAVGYILLLNNCSGLYIVTITIHTTIYNHFFTSKNILSQIVFFLLPINLNLAHFYFYF